MFVLGLPATTIIYAHSFSPFCSSSVKMQLKSIFGSCYYIRTLARLICHVTGWTSHGRTSNYKLYDSCMTLYGNGIKQKSLYRSLPANSLSPFGSESQLAGKLHRRIQNTNAWSGYHQSFSNFHSFSFIAWQSKMCAEKFSFFLFPELLAVL